MTHETIEKTAKALAIAAWSIVAIFAHISGIHWLAMGCMLGVLALIWVALD